jgi:hypothetical protein
MSPFNFCVTVNPKTCDEVRSTYFIVMVDGCAVLLE